jgi:hypothetical protein
VHLQVLEFLKVEVALLLAGRLLAGRLFGTNGRRRRSGVVTCDAILNASGPSLALKTSQRAGGFALLLSIPLHESLFLKVGLALLLAGRLLAGRLLATNRRRRRSGVVGRDAVLNASVPSLSLMTSQRASSFALSLLVYQISTEKTSH